MNAKEQVQKQVQLPKHARLAEAREEFNKLHKHRSVTSGKLQLVRNVTEQVK